MRPGERMLRFDVGEAASMKARRESSAQAATPAYERNPAADRVPMLGPDDLILHYAPCRPWPRWLPHRCRDPWRVTARLLAWVCA